jgi:multicomponent K+:H+ antiporter subunit F
MLLNIWRIVKSPSVGDRVLALDTMVINGIALIVLYGILNNTAVYFEVSLTIAMVGFISTVAYARFVLRGNLIE